jgi:hypothetical protein
MSSVNSPLLILPNFIYMKKVFSLALMALLAFSCSQDRITDIAEDTVDFNGERKCSSHDIYEQMLASDPIFAQRQAEYDQQAAAYNPATTDRAIRTIPVVVNVVYRTAAQNISLAQIQSQIDILNADFAATNADYGLIPSFFLPVASGDTEVRFVLDAVYRKQSNKTSWSTNDAVKKSNQGGLSPTSPSTKLNIWVCNLGNGVLGYAQFPGGPVATDGVVLDDNATGNTGTASAPFNLGRTATHEVGHWLNLRHIWGDTTCGSDLVSDTPTHNTSNGGCPSQPHFSTCSGAPREMTMNYMDYTNDACMYMFSAGQDLRMNAALDGPRAAWAF